jgi:type II secretory pathway pseudopilin PulG
MPYPNPDHPEASGTAPRYLLIFLLILLIAAVGIGSYLFAHHDAAANLDRADRRAAELAQVQDQLRSAAKQNDYLAEQVRQGNQDLTNAGADSQSKERKLRALLSASQAAQAKTKAKLRGLSSGLSGSMGAVRYIPPTQKGSAGRIEGSITIANAATVPLNAVCVVDVGSVAYAVTSHAVPDGGSVLETFQFPYAGAKPSGVSSGGCGRL